MVSTLDQLKLGESGSIKRVSSSFRELRTRLLSLGLTEGREVSVRCMAPFGGPINIDVGGFTLSLRRDEARAVEVFL